MMKYKIDVGSMPKNEAEAYLEKVTKKFKNRLVYKPTEVEYKPEIIEQTCCKREDDYFYPHPDIPIKTPKKFLTDFGGFYYDECDKQWKLEQYSSYGWEGYKKNKIKVRKKEK